MMMKKNLKSAAACITAAWLLLGMLGCEAFVKKFTRKPKKDRMPQEELVLAPEEYQPPRMSREEAYRQSFLYWKSWHDELIQSLLSGTNHKKQTDCARQALENLLQLRSLLDEASQKSLDTYIDRMRSLEESISNDVYSSNQARNRLSAEHLKQDILRDFSYERVKDHLT